MVALFAAVLPGSPTALAFSAAIEPLFAMTKRPESHVAVTGDL